MPATQRIGERRVWAIYRIIGAIVYFGFVSWLTLGIAFLLATIYAIGDVLSKLFLNRRMKFGKESSEAILRHQYHIIYWIFGYEMWPGWLP